MTPDSKRIVLAALRYYLGDDHRRARAAFRGLTDAQLDQPFGENGLTRRQALDTFERHASDVRRAIAEVEAL